MTNYGPPPTIIRRGQRIWDEFYEDVGVRTADIIALFDKHDVVGPLNYNQAVYVGEAIDRILGARSVLLSFGRNHPKARFRNSEPWNPFIRMLDGYIFTDYRECWRDHVEVYREDWMPTSCIAIRGDKGQAAELFKRPALLFDDKEKNIDLVRSRSTDSITLDGVVVKLGRKRRHQVNDNNYVADYDSYYWADLMQKFQYHYGRGSNAYTRGELEIGHYR